MAAPDVRPDPGSTPAGAGRTPLPAACRDALAHLARIAEELAKPRAEADDTGALAAISGGTP